MEDDIDNLPDGMLVTLPDASIPAGRLAAIWARKAAVAQQHNEGELVDELEGISRSRRMIGGAETPQEMERREQRELKAREEEFLRRISLEQDRIRRAMEELDERTIRLHDGRRAYVDGEGYRDGEGRALQGADRDEAQAQHRRNSHAATWTEKQDLERRAETAKEIKDRVLQHRGDPEDLAQNEKEFAQKIQARTAQLENNPDPYASSDYAAVYQGADRTTSHAATLNDTPDTRKLKQEFSPAAAGQGGEATNGKNGPQPVPSSAPNKTFTR